MRTLTEIWKQAEEKKLLLRMGIYFLGTAISALGTALMTLNGLGSDAMNTLFDAIAVKLRTQSGNIYTVFNTSMLILGFLCAKRYMGIGSVLMILFQGFFINNCQRLLLGMPWLFTQTSWKIIAAVLSYFCRCFGCALSTSVCLGTAGFEAWLFALADKIKIEYKYLKLISEVVFFGSALALNGVFGVMTIVSVFFFGHGLSFFMIGLNRTIWTHLDIQDERNELSRNRRKQKNAPNNAYFRKMRYKKIVNMSSHNLKYNNAQGSKKEMHYEKTNRDSIDVGNGSCTGCLRL